MVNQVTTTRPLDTHTHSEGAEHSGADNEAFDKVLGNGPGMRSPAGGTQGTVVNDGPHGQGPNVQGPQGGKGTDHCGCGPEQLDRAFGKPDNGGQGGGLPANLLGDLKQLTSDFKSGNMGAVAQDIGKLLTDLMGGSSSPATTAQGVKAPPAPAGSSTTPPNSATPPSSTAPAGAGKPNPVSGSSPAIPGASPGGMQDLMAMLEKLLKDLKSGDKAASDSDLQKLLSMLGGAGGADGGSGAGGADNSGAPDSAPQGTGSQQGGLGQGVGSPLGGSQGAGGPGPAPSGGSPSAGPNGAAPGTPPAGQPTAQQPDMSAVLKAITSLLEDLKSGNTQGIQQDIQALSDTLQKTPAPAGASA